MSDTPTITCKPNGPYIVRQLADLRDAQGAPIETKAVLALCRCGGSASKPFCDGTHLKNGFTDEKRADAAGDKLDHYRGGRITVHDNRSICAHSGVCSDRLDAVFRYKQEPWIDPDGADAEAIVETIRRCPSGALSYSFEEADGGDQTRGPSISVTKDGPYAVAGGVQLSDVARAEGASTEHYTLCRCGASKNKPFCDGSHWDAGFKDG